MSAKQKEFAPKEKVARKKETLHKKCQRSFLFVDNNILEHTIEAAN